MINKFEKDKYVLVKKAISKDMATFLYNYFLVKQQVYDIALKEKYMSPYEKLLGAYGDGQVPNCYINYGDIAGDTLLLKLQSLVEKHVNKKLYPNYSYARNYRKKDELPRHTDRFSCEISTTIFLGGDPWPIYIDLTGKENQKGTKFNLKPGDMIIYKGNILEHWREPLEGECCVQLFLHYQDVKTKGAKQNLYDGRPCVGLPRYFKKDVDIFK